MTIGTLPANDRRMQEHFGTTAQGPIDTSTTITVQVRVSLKEYVILLLRLTYTKPALTAIVGVGLLMAAWVVGRASGLTFLSEPQNFQYITLALIFGVQPLFIFLTIRRTYLSSDHLRTPVEMCFDTEQYRIAGKSFHAEHQWSGLFKVVELRDWYMLYHNSLSAVLVPKRSFQAGQHRAFKAMLRAVPGLHLHLRKKWEPSP